MNHKEMLLIGWKVISQKNYSMKMAHQKNIVKENTLSGDQRMAMNPVTNGGIDPRSLKYA